MSQHISVPSIGSILYGSVSTLLNFQVKYNDTGASVGIEKAILSVLDTKHPLLLEFFAHVVTAFNAATANNISVGSTQNGSEFLLASDITAGTIGFYPAANANKKYVVSANTPIYVRASGNFSTGTLTSNNTQVTAADTVTINGLVYTFVSSIGTTPGNVLLQTNADTSLTNLAASLNGSAGAGTTYIAQTSATGVTSSAVSAHAIVVTSAVGGTTGNSIGASKSAATLTWSGLSSAKLSGGTDATAGDVHVYCRVTELFPDPSSALPVL